MELLITPEENTVSRRKAKKFFFKLNELFQGVNHEDIRNVMIVKYRYLTMGRCAGVIGDPICAFAAAVLERCEPYPGDPIGEVPEDPAGRFFIYPFDEEYHLVIDTIASTRDFIRTVDLKNINFELGRWYARIRSLRTSFGLPDDVHRYKRTMRGPWTSLWINNATKILRHCAPYRDENEDFCGPNGHNRFIIEPSDEHLDKYR